MFETRNNSSYHVPPAVSLLSKTLILSKYCSAANAAAVTDPIQDKLVSKNMTPHDDTLTRSTSTYNRHRLNGLVISLHFRLNQFHHKDRCNKDVNFEVRSDNKICDGVKVGRSNSSYSSAIS